MPDGTKLAEFVAWCQKHVTGDEKGDAQLFLDRLFQAFGHAGLKEAGPRWNSVSPKLPRLAAARRSPTSFGNPSC